MVPWVVKTVLAPSHDTFRVSKNLTPGKQEGSMPNGILGIIYPIAEIALGILGAELVVEGLRNLTLKVVPLTASGFQIKH